MPGSRHSEIKHHMPILVPMMVSALKKYPNLEIHVPCAQTLTLDELWAYFDEEQKKEVGGRLLIHEGGESHLVLERCHAALIASGTSILQGVMSNRPLVLFYRLDGLTYWIGKKLIDLKYVGLSNLIGEKEVNRELLQDDMNEASLILEMERLMWNNTARDAMLKDFDRVQKLLGQPGASDRAAKVVLDNML
jgi:lipid-A-disaccharide synthase